MLSSDNLTFERKPFQWNERKQYGSGKLPLTVTHFQRLIYTSSYDRVAHQNNPCSTGTFFPCMWHGHTLRYQLGSSLSVHQTTTVCTIGSVCNINNLKAHEKKTKKQRAPCKLELCIYNHRKTILYKNIYKLWKALFISLAVFPDWRKRRKKERGLSDEWGGGVGGK